MAFFFGSFLTENMDHVARMIIVFSFLFSVYVVYKTYVFIKAIKTLALAIEVDDGILSVSSINGNIRSDLNSLSFRKQLGDGTIPVTLVPKKSEYICMQKADVDVIVPNQNPVFTDLRSVLGAT